MSSLSEVGESHLGWQSRKFLFSFCLVSLLDRNHDARLTCRRISLDMYGDLSHITSHLLHTTHIWVVGRGDIEKQHGIRSLRTIDFNLCFHECQVLLPNHRRCILLLFGLYFRSLYSSNTPCTQLPSHLGKFSVKGHDL